MLNYLQGKLIAKKYCVSFLNEKEKVLSVNLPRSGKLKTKLDLVLCLNSNNGLPPWSLSQEIFFFRQASTFFSSVLSLLFKVTDWPKEDYGKFYSGDSYIILNTYKDKESDEVEKCYNFKIVIIKVLKNAFYI